MLHKVPPLRRILVRAAPLLLAAACAGPQHAGRRLTGTPLECGRGSGESAASVIDSAGGTVSVRGHSLALPRGAVNGNTPFRITERATTHIGVEVEPHGTGFNQNANATLTLSYARCEGTDVDDRRLTIVEVRSGTTQVLRTLPSVVDSVARTVTTTGLDHLSGYLIGSNREGEGD